jgi:hypothetical protein
MQVELSSTNSEGCIFKILPRYKVRSVGDEVRYNDQAKFESVRTEGQFLHCSSRYYMSELPVLEHWFVYGTISLWFINIHTYFKFFYHSYELNLSGTESALTIVPHYRPMPSHHLKTLRVRYRNFNNFVSQLSMNTIPGRGCGATVPPWEWVLHFCRGIFRSSWWHRRWYNIIIMLKFRCSYLYAILCLIIIL